MPFDRHSDSVSQERQTQLFSWQNFEQILAALLRGQLSEAGLEEGREDRLTGLRRVAVVLLVDPPVYDGLFNSPVGYRAMYARSVGAGKACNRQVIDTLRSRLLSATAGHIRSADVSSSLAGGQAKIWIDEDEPGVRAHLDAPGNEILYAPWADKSKSGKGLRAPVGRRLAVKGGWVDRSGVEVLDEWKIYRSHDIHETGYS
jgi:hypothetical protein